MDNTETNQPAPTHLVTVWHLSIKTAPHQDWTQPFGWGPCYTRSEADRALALAQEQWMGARLTISTERRSLTWLEAADLRRQGATVTALGARAV